MLRTKFRIFLSVLNKYTLLILLLLWSLLFVVGCRNDVEERPIPTNFQNKSWLDGFPCNSPCWFGLIPGKATKTDVLVTLEELDFLDIETVVVRASQYYDFSTGEYLPAQRIEVQYFMKKGERGHVRFLIADEYLVLIEEILNYEITIGELVHIYGEPDYILPIEQPQIKGDSYCSIEIIWKERQLVARYQERGSDSWLEVCEEISNGASISPGVLSYSFSIIDENTIMYYELNEYIVSWPGFVNK